MRILFALIVLCPLTALSQQDTAGLNTRQVQAYVLPDEQACIGYTLDTVLSVDAIAGMFGSSTGAIYRANRVLSFRPPEKGDLLNVPVDLSSRLTLFGHSDDHVAVMYTVRKGETLFRIARMYFDLSVEMLMQLNHLESPDLSIGQQVLLGYLEVHDTTSAEYPDIEAIADTLVADPFADQEVFYDKGVALWNKEHPEFQQLFAMHRHARINSMLEITNPMFNSKVLVKVVGQIPRTFSDDITVVVSPGVARKLGAIDSRFYVQLRYVK